MEGFDYIQAIGAELQKADQLAAEMSERIGIFTVKTANRTIREAALRPNPDALWLTLWYEGEVCCLFSDSNLGKSIYAVQIATSIAKKQKVLYFDFELSDKQFQLRYSDEANNLNQFSDNLYRVEINRDSLDAVNFEEAVIGNIEQTAIKLGAKVLIIDNLTYLCVASEKGDAAGTLMLRLMALKRKYGLSMLILAHTPKRCLSNPITQNDLAGSKKLYNFFDSVFAIGKSAKNSSVRYIKQLKVRYGNYTYDADNVIVCVIEKVGTFLQFVDIGYAVEKEHLKEPSEKDSTQEKETIKRMVAEGKTYRVIASELGVTLGKVQRALKT
ncbi:AAA family ATPase [Bacteroides sp.]|uniref:AAA family ATPase n=1 Tax=Bacteroides sp. TaxID=29523 RepID=UPI002583C364|nr:AAA family ATPase [Bacteroides sp.]